MLYKTLGHEAIINTNTNMKILRLPLSYRIKVLVDYSCTPENTAMFPQKSLFENYYPCTLFFGLFSTSFPREGLKGGTAMISSCYTLI